MNFCFNVTTYKQQTCHLANDAVKFMRTVRTLRKHHGLLTMRSSHWKVGHRSDTLVLLCNKFTLCSHLHVDTSADSLHALDGVMCSRLTLARATQLLVLHTYPPPTHPANLARQTSCCSQKKAHRHVRAFANGLLALQGAALAGSHLLVHARQLHREERLRVAAEVCTGTAQRQQMPCCSSYAVRHIFTAAAGAHKQETLITIGKAATYGW